MVDFLTIKQKIPTNCALDVQKLPNEGVQLSLSFFSLQEYLQLKVMQSPGFLIFEKKASQVGSKIYLQ